MKLSPNVEQAVLIQTVEKIVERGEAVRRSITMSERNEHDGALYDELQRAGFMSKGLVDGYGELEAGLVTDTVMKCGGLVPAGASMLVYPSIVKDEAPGPVALATWPASSPIRFLPQAAVLLILCDKDVRVLHLQPGDVELVDNGSVGWPLGRLVPGAIDRAEILTGVFPAEIQNWWRVALALEAGGIMRGALDATVNYVKERTQFDRPIGSFQSVQHRLAQMAVRIEGVRWLALRAAYDEADPVAAAAAATHATVTAPIVFRETHQLHGAIGFTREYHLHVWTMRLTSLQQELMGRTSHSRDLARMRYGISPAAA